MRYRWIVAGGVLAASLLLATGWGFVHSAHDGAQAMHVQGALITWQHHEGNAYDALTITRDQDKIILDQVKADPYTRSLTAQGAQATIGGVQAHLSGVHANYRPGLTGGWSMSGDRISISMPGAMITGRGEGWLDPSGHLVRVRLEDMTLTKLLPGDPAMLVHAQQATILFDPSPRPTASGPADLDGALVDGLLEGVTISGGLMPHALTGDYLHVQFHPNDGRLANLDISLIGASMHPEEWPFLAGMHLDDPMGIRLQAHVDLVQGTAELDAAADALGSGGIVVRAVAPETFGAVLAGTQPLQGVSIGWNDTGWILRVLNRQAEHQGEPVDQVRSEEARRLRDTSLVSMQILSLNDVLRFLMGNQSIQVQLTFPTPLTLQQMVDNFWSLPKNPIAGQIVVLAPGT